MNLRDNLKLFVTLRLPVNQKIKTRYDFARQQSSAMFSALLDTVSYSEYNAGGEIYDEHSRTIKAIRRLLLEPELHTKLASYCDALNRNDMSTVVAIETELN